MLHSFHFQPFRIVGICALFLLAACQQKSEASFANRVSNAPAPPPTEESASALDRAPAVVGNAKPFEDAASNGDVFSSAAAVPGAIDSLKRFVRTAELRFRVHNTAAATLRIEDIVLRNGGFVLNSQLNSEIELRQTTPVSRDSALETTRYTIHSQLVIRVPYRMLDTTLRTIGKLSDFLDLRHVNAEDKGLQMLEQELAKLRENLYQTELANSEENKISPKADRARSSRAASDQARIEALKIEDAIRFSTVTVDIYQLPQVYTSKIANTDIPVPQDPFAARLGDALSSGGEIICLLFLGIVRLWGVLLLVVAGYFAWKMFRKRKPSETAAA